MADTKTFLLVIGAKLLNFSIFRSTRTWVGGLSVKSELSQSLRSLNCEIKLWQNLLLA
jgi:hypothetical protein